MSRPSPSRCSDLYIGSRLRDANRRQQGAAILLGNADGNEVPFTIQKIPYCRTWL